VTSKQGGGEKKISFLAGNFSKFALLYPPNLISAGESKTQRFLPTPPLYKG